jgi:hypothetical protein
MNYHALSKMRNLKDCSSGSICGAPNDKDKRFCLKSDQKCPLNAVYTIPQTQELD